MMIGKYGGKIQESWNIQNTSPKSKRPSIIFSYEKKICMITVPQLIESKGNKARGGRGLVRHRKYNPKNISNKTKKL